MLAELFPRQITIAERLQGIFTVTTVVELTDTVKYEPEDKLIVFFAIAEVLLHFVDSLVIPPLGMIAKTEPPVQEYPASVSIAEFPFDVEMTRTLPPSNTIPLYDVLLLESMPSPFAQIQTVPPLILILVPEVAGEFIPSSEETMDTLPFVT